MYENSFDTKDYFGFVFVFICSIEKSGGFGDMKETAKALQARAFADKLQKRVTNQIETKIFQVGMLRACIREDEEWFEEKEIKWSDIEDTCIKDVQDIKSSIKDRYPKMRLNLALSSPAAKEDRILSDSATWLDSTPTQRVIKI